MCINSSRNLALCFVVVFTLTQATSKAASSTNLALCFVVVFILTQATSKAASSSGATNLALCFVVVVFILTQATSKAASSSGSGGGLSLVLKSSTVVRSNSQSHTNHLFYPLVHHADLPLTHPPHCLLPSRSDGICHSFYRCLFRLSSSGRTRSGLLGDLAHQPSELSTTPSLTLSM